MDVARRWDAARFAVDDGTGSLELDRDGWEFVSEPSSVLCDGTTRPPPELVVRVRGTFPWLEDGSAGGNLATLNMSCRESIVEVGDSVCVAGTVVDTDSGKRFREQAGTPVIVTDQSPDFLLNRFRSSAAWRWLLASALLVAAIGYTAWSL